MVISVDVDDLLVTGTSVDLIERFKEQMSSSSKISNLGKLSYYLGIEVDQGQGYIEFKK